MSATSSSHEVSQDGLETIEPAKTKKDEETNSTETETEADTPTLPQEIEDKNEAGQNHAANNATEDMDFGFVQKQHSEGTEGKDAIETEISFLPLEMEDKSEAGQNHAIEDMDLGVLKKILNCCLDKSHATYLTILVLILLSFGDPGSDLGMTSYFWRANQTIEASLVLATDYLPAFLTLAHFCMSSMRSNFNLRQQLILGAVIMLLNPFLPPICYFLWLVFLMSGRQKGRDVFHFLAKLSSGIAGTFEVRFFLICVIYVISITL